LGTQLNTLGAQSYGQNFVDQLRAQASGQANPWISLVSGLFGNAAKGYSMNAGGKTPGSIPFGSSYVGDTTGATANYA
jgi:hypothetical protein